MASRWGDTLVLLLIGIGIIALLLVALMNWQWVLIAILVIIAIVVFLVAALIIVGVISAIPLYALKYRKPSEPGSYDLEKVRSIKEDEKK